MVPEDELTDIRPSRQRIALVLAIAAAGPALVVRAAAPDLPHALEAALFGLAIVGAAFILSWAAEVAHLKRWTSAPSVSGMSLAAYRSRRLAGEPCAWLRTCRLRLAAHARILRGNLGFANQTLLGFGLKPRRPRKKKTAEATPAQGPETPAAKA